MENKELNTSKVDRKENKAITIAFEGGEGSGKGTLIREFIDFLEEKSISYLQLREPGGKKISEEIREIILDKENTQMSYLTEAYLYAAARSQLISDHLNEFKDKDIIIFDRSIYSSLAYQGYARGLGIDVVYNINKHIGPYIDLVIYLKLDPKVGIDRIMKNRKDEINRLDLEKIDFHAKVQEGYDLLAKNEKDKFIILDASKDKEAVFNDLINLLKERNIIRED